MSPISPIKLSEFFYSYYLMFLIFLLELQNFSYSSHLEVINSTSESYNAISHFRVLNRRTLLQCPDVNPYLGIDTSSKVGLADEENVTVTITGVLVPSESDWVAMVTPSNSDVSFCPLNFALYKETGDTSTLPLLCHYPVKHVESPEFFPKAQFMTNDPSYMKCENSECKRYNKKGLETPCILKKSDPPLKFANPSSPLYGHLSSIDSTGTSMKLTWVSGDNKPQQLHYGDENGRKSQTSQVTTFTQADMCSSDLPSPAKDFGWHDPGYIHSAVMLGLQPSHSYTYIYGSGSVGWSDEIQFRTPPAAGTGEVRFLAFGDMGKAPRDASIEHYIQPGSLSVVEAMKEEVASGNVDSVFHIGDISYATGFLVEWDYFLHLITPIASHVSYMTAIGNHERDYVNTGSVYETPDSGGECGVAYERYFPMPTVAEDKPWYSIEQASVHFTVMSTEHDWSENSEQYEWMEKDLGLIDRSRTPWVVFMGHRPMYSSVVGLPPSVDPKFVDAVEPLLVNKKVDLVLWGHVHNYERTCGVYKGDCMAMPIKDDEGVDTYDHSNYTAPVHAVIGMAGFTLDEFADNVVNNWSLSRISEFGYARIHATKDELRVEFVNSNKRKIEDSFRITNMKNS